MDIGVFLGLLLVLGVGLVCYVIGRITGETIEGPLSSGGTGLVVGALLGLLGYFQIRYGAMVIQESWWPLRTRLAHNSEQPLRYWLTTVLFSVGSLTALVGALLCFFGAMP